MANAFELPASVLIPKLAEELEKIEVMVAPAWAPFVKTGAHAQRLPQQKNWWYIRCASVLRTVYVDGPVGVERLRTKYGGRKNRGSRPQKSVEAGGKILRTALQKLEKAGFIEQKKGQGRVMSPGGRAFVDKIATGLKVGLEKINPALQKY